MFNDGLKRTKEEHAKPASPQVKSRKADSGDDTNPASEKALLSVPGKQISRPSLTGQIKLLSKDEIEQESDQGKLTAGLQLSAAQLKVQEPDTAENIFSSTGLNKDAGSILMALMIQSRSGDLTAPPQAGNAQEAPEHKEVESSTAAESSLLPMPASVPLTPAPNTWNPASEPQSSPAVQKAGRQVESAADSDDDTRKASAGAVPGHLVFALRLNAALHASSSESFTSVPNAPAPGAAAENAPLTASTSAMTGTIEFSQTSSGSGKKEHSGDQSDPGAPAFIDPTASAAVHVAEQPFSLNETPATAPPPEVDDRLHEYSTEPVRNVHMQVVGEDKTRVDIRLMDRAGELRVSVKSADSLLNHNLQQQMPELTARLESARYQTEVWMPSSAQAGSSAQAPVNRAPGKNGLSSSRPDWVEALEGSTPQSIERIY